MSTSTAEQDQHVSVFELCEYEPHPLMVGFHDSQARFRYSACGIKSGKTYAGAYDFAEECWSTPNLFAWVVAPTYGQLDTCEAELMTIFETCERAGTKVLAKRQQRNRKYFLTNGTVIQAKTAEHPDYLRGPNVDRCWVDEAAFIKDAAWHQIRQRTAAREGEVIATTSPNGRNWLWNECLKAGMPPAAPYGQWEDHGRYVVHHPTWAFGWVTTKDIEDMRATMPRDAFDRDYGALFTSDGQSVFRYIEEAFHAAPLRDVDQHRYVMGLDLAKQQDWTAWVVMDGQGWVRDLDRWTGVDWSEQKRRVKDVADKFRAVVVLDHANVGSTIADDLRRLGVSIHPVELNSAQVKTSLVQAMQSTFDGRQVRIPDPRAPWAPPAARYLVDELRAYRASLTRGGRLSYGAPKGLHDDLAIALCLANWGRMHGLAGGGVTSAEVVLGRDEFEKALSRGPRLRRPRTFSRIFGRRTRAGLGGASGPIWR